MVHKNWKTLNPAGSRRVLVTKELPGEHWIRVLKNAGCLIEVCTSDTTLSTHEIQAAIGTSCDAVIGQLTEFWGEELFTTLKKAGGSIYSNYAVGHNNIDILEATAAGIAVGNTPGVLTQTTAELAVALTFAVARRITESERYLRQGKFHGWLPNLFVGELLHGKTVGVIGAGRIGSAYAKMMVEGHKVNILYLNRYPNEDLEETISRFSEYNLSCGGDPVFCKQAESISQLLKESDIVSLHVALNRSSHHLMNTKRLSMMKENAILINTCRGPVIDEKALVAHAKENPEFRVGLDVFEHEPSLTPGLLDMDNITLLPHIGSATTWTRSGMASLAACNITGRLSSFPVWGKDDMHDFLTENPPKASPSIINADELGIPAYHHR